MGCCESTPSGAPAGEDCGMDAGGGDLNGDAPGGEWRSRIFGPPNADANAGPYPTLIVTHGMEDEEVGWLKFLPFCEDLSKLGFIVLLVGMPDDDESIVTKYPEAKTLWGDLCGRILVSAVMKLTNMWPAAYYSIVMSQAVDHVIAVAPSKLGLQVDTRRIGLVGHSMGGGGVLCAAARDCKDKICAVAAISPSHMSVETPFDNIDGVLKYGSGADHSNEHGEGTVPHLKDIVAATFIYGSQAEYNTGLIDTKSVGLANFSGCWPSFPHLFEQVGAAKKELYVDNVVNQDFITGHTNLVYENRNSYENGLPFQVLCSFLRRHVAGSAEAAPSTPSNIKEWRQEAGKTEASAKMEFTISVTKAAEGEASKVGLDITQIQEKYLKINKVKDGVVMEWNRANADKEVKADDCIMSVNGVRDSSKAILDEIKKATQLEISISR